MVRKKFIDPETGDEVILDVEADSGAGADSAPRTNDDWARLRQTTSKANKLERENVMLRAGVDPDSEMGGYFARGYEGDMTVEAVREAAVKAGVTKAPAGDQQTAPTTAQQTGPDGQPLPLTDEQRRQAAAEASQRITGVATGAAPHGGDPADQLRAAAAQGTAGVVAAARELGMAIAQDGAVLYQAPQSG